MKRQRILFAGTIVATVAIVASVMRKRRRRRKKLVMTGGCGNLASKLGAHLGENGDWEIIGIEHPDFIKERPYRVVVSDVLDKKGSWRHVIKGADALIHFSAVNPYPNATWQESAESMSHTFNVFLEAKAQRVPRIILASSNHVCGGYKDDFEHGLIKPSDPPRCGTLLLDKNNLAKSGDAVAYAAAKLAGERLALALSDSITSFIVLRVGWCQPFENLPTTICAAGVPEIFQTKTDTNVVNTASDDTWFKQMWLSNADFLALFSAALSIPLPPNDNFFALINAMSRNSGARWSLTETAELLNVMPQSDAATYA
mmetsp:Transcript_19334/g.29354  ORF Transcript_19334/g.29354 Transcript_19334/m.29354 type:complete len:314 (+) Transcript_19334:8-949(+)